MNKMLPLLMAGVLALPALSPADEITLKDGRVIDGEILEDNGTVLKVKVKKGTLTLNKTDVVGIVKKLTVEQEYAERVKKLDPKSATGQLGLGQWAAAHEMKEEAARHLLAAWKIDPALKTIAEELQRLDYHLVDKEWQDPDTYYPLQGWQKLDGRWMAPGEHAWRSGLKEIEALTAARDEAKAGFSKAPSVKKIDAQVAEEDKKLEKLKKDLAKEEPALVEANKKVQVAREKCEAASKALQKANEKGMEGDSTKETPASKEAQKKLDAANEAAAKSRAAADAISKRVDAIKAEMSACDKRKEALAEERRKAEDELAPQKAELEKAEQALADAKAKVEAAKAEWEKSKK